MFFCQLSHENAFNQRFHLCHNVFSSVLYLGYCFSGGKMCIATSVHGRRHCLVLFAENFVFGKSWQPSKLGSAWAPQCSASSSCITARRYKVVAENFLTPSRRTQGWLTGIKWSVGVTVILVAVCVRQPVSDWLPSLWRVLPLNRCPLGLNHQRISGTSRGCFHSVLSLNSDWSCHVATLSAFQLLSELTASPARLPLCVSALHSAFHVVRRLKWLESFQTENTLRPISLIRTKPVVLYSGMSEFWFIPVGTWISCQNIQVCFHSRHLDHWESHW